VRPQISPPRRSLKLWKLRPHQRRGREWTENTGDLELTTRGHPDSHSPSPPSPSKVITNKTVPCHFKMSEWDPLKTLTQWPLKDSILTMYSNPPPPHHPHHHHHHHPRPRSLLHSPVRQAQRAELGVVEIIVELSRTSLSSRTENLRHSPTGTEIPSHQLSVRQQEPLLVTETRGGG